LTQPKRPAEEERLDFFIGTWTNSGHVSPGAFGPGGPASGTTGYRWDVGGRWLLYHSRFDIRGLGRYEVHGGLSFNSRTGKYDAYAANSLGNLLVYEGEWSDGDKLIFTQIHPGPKGTSRLIYTFSGKGSIRMISQRLAAGGKFETYFETTFSRPKTEKGKEE